MSSIQKSSTKIGNNSQVLRFAEEGTFKISIFSDLHYGEAQDSGGSENDARTAGVMEKIISAERPQLVVLNGDLITGGATDSSNSSLYVDRLVTPLLQHDVHWASTYGNHDSDDNLCPQNVFDRDEQYKNSLTQRMVFNSSAGFTNYYLLVWPYDMAAETPAVILWFFDTRGGNTCSEMVNNPRMRPNWIHPSVTEWFGKTHSALTVKYNKTIPSLAFFHIPTYAMRAFQDVGVDDHTEQGINDDVPVKHQGYFGTERDYMGQDIAFMQILLSTQGLIATFSGHDHGNDWCFNWNRQLPGMNLTGNELNMCFGRRTGYGGYGNWPRGGRQVFLHEPITETSVQTWVRVEDGTASKQVTLNSTYGHYPYTEESQASKSAAIALILIVINLLSWLL
ncbi:Metallo-dependent phosphatase-like protein [Aspergillus pseudonomiae]|uniref:Metallo-dependent phosphatase-like protein n=1 Tax=Aspergillus pseudonomiae TaxID=1506151 RepID=A0A5N7CUB2_9EURO|nr:Metallo-dependent phosphatase-like protein [Aspergillus pseudonomiae]KAE8397714.1 Metallo-dependent phosphatase-like protein [Aspergillus pseudonomiae]